MFRTLLVHSWKKTLRSPAFSQQLVQTIFLGFLFLYFAASFALLGFVAGKAIKEEYPEENIFQFIGGFLVYYFLFDLVLRIMLQKYPVLDIRKYLHLNIRKSRLTHFFLLKSLGSFFNYLPLFAIVPFVVINYPDLVGNGYMLSFPLILLGWIVFNNYFGLFLDRFLKHDNWVAYAGIGVLVLILFMDRQGYIALLPYFRSATTLMLDHPFLALIPLALGILFYVINFRTLSNNLYLEDLMTKEASEVSQLDLGFLERFGQAGKLMNMEVKLIWRNRRSRFGVIFSLVMLFYPLIFMRDEALNVGFVRMFLGLFITGFFALNYGQLMLSWNSTHFDLLATRNIKIRDIFRAKYYIMLLSCVILTILSMGYGFLDVSFLRVIIVMFFFNAGITIFIYMLMASYNSKRIDPGKGAMMNYEGIGVGHFLIIFPLLAIPGLIRWPFAAHGHPVLGELFVGFLGLLGLLFHPYIIDFCTRIFMRNRYKIMAAFRKKQ